MMQSSERKKKIDGLYFFFFFGECVCVCFIFYQDTEKWGAQISFSSSNAWILLMESVNHSKLGFTSSQIECVCTSECAVSIDAATAAAAAVCLSVSFTRTEFDQQLSVNFELKIF